jgi:hypothetical protein
MHKGTKNPLSRVFPKTQRQVKINKNRLMIKITESDRYAAKMPAITIMQKDTAGRL